MTPRKVRILLSMQHDWVFYPKKKDRAESAWLARVGKDGGESPTSVSIRVGLDFLESTRDFAIFKPLGCIKKKNILFVLG